MKRPNHEARAADVWDVLVAQAKSDEVITYGDLGRRIGVHHRALRYALEPIQTYCLEAGLPPLTILVQSIDGQLGGGFIAWDRSRLDEGVQQVWAHPWENLENPFDFWRSGETLQSLVQEVIAAPDRSEAVFARVRVRGTQQRVFREVLEEIYDGACALSGSMLSVGLEACHIIPWIEANQAEAFDPRNGLLMQVWYHRLFDAGCFDIDEQYYVRVPGDMKRDGSVSDQEMLQRIDGHRVRLPANRALWPSQELLARRRNG